MVKKYKEQDTFGGIEVPATRLPSWEVKAFRWIRELIRRIFSK